MHRAPSTAKVLTCVARLHFIHAIVGLGLHFDSVCHLQLGAKAAQQAASSSSSSSWKKRRAKEEEEAERRREGPLRLLARFAELSVAVAEDEQAARISFVSRGKAHEYLLDRFNIFTPGARLVKHTEIGDVPISNLPLSFRSREKNKRATLTRRADNLSSGLFEFEGQLYQLDPLEGPIHKHPSFAAARGGIQNHYAYFGAHKLSMVKEPNLISTIVQPGGGGEVLQKAQEHHREARAGGPARRADGALARNHQTSSSSSSASAPQTPERHRPEGHTLVLDIEGPTNSSTTTRASNTGGIERRSDPSEDYEGTEWLGTEWYPGCFDGDENMHQFEVGLIGDYQAYKIYGESLPSMLEDYVIKASLLYEGQMHIELVIGYLEIFASAQDAPSWANPCASTGSFVDRDDFTSTFNDLKAWYDEQLTPVTYFSDSPWFEGHMHGFTGCGPLKDLVGLAFIGTICNPWAAGLGMTRIQSDSPESAWLIFAHELGHSLGAYHPFDKGQPGGGIMDYGNWKVDGVYQFNTPYRKEEVCPVLDKALKKCPQQFYDKVHGETPAPTPEFVCEDEPSGWSDKYGDSCITYWWADYCTASGGIGTGWGAGWGTFAQSSNLGTSAEFACCECGGGKYVSRAPTPSPSQSPTGSPTTAPTGLPTVSPTESPTAEPTAPPTSSPTASPTNPTTTLPMLPWHYMPPKSEAEAATTTAVTTSRPEVAPVVQGALVLAALNFTALEANATLKDEVISVVKENLALKVDAAENEIVVTLKDGSASRRYSTDATTVAEYIVMLDPSVDVNSVTAELSDPSALADVATEVEELPGIEAVATGDVQVLESSAEQVTQSQPATAFGDPHLKNVYGEVFDIEREGDLTFLAVPRNASQDTATFYAQAHIDRRRGASCGALYITGLVLTGSALGEFKRLEFESLTEDFNTPGSRSLKIDDSPEMSVEEFATKVQGSKVVTNVTVYDPEEPTELNHHVTTLMLRVMFGIGKLKLRWEHQKEKHGYTNWLHLEFTGLGQVTEDIGGLLGTADHTWVSTIPEECAENHRKVAWGFMVGSASFD